MKRHAAELFRLPIGEDQPLGGRLRIVKHALTLVVVATFARSSGRYLPRAARNSSRSRHFLAGKLLFEPVGHQRLVRRDDLIDVLAQERSLLPLGVEQLERGLRFRRQEAGE